MENGDAEYANSKMRKTQIVVECVENIKLS